MRISEMTEALLVSLLLLVLVAAVVSCQRVDVTPSPAGAPTPMAVPTATSVPPTATPTPTSTATPTPTPTPTFEQLKLAQIRGFRWYDSDRISEEARDGATEVMCQIASNFPELYDELTGKGWVSGAVHENGLTKAIGIAEFLSEIGDLMSDEGVALDILDMPFLDILDHREIETMETLVHLAGRGADRFRAFLGYPGSGTPGGIGDIQDRHETEFLRLFYARTNHADTLAAILGPNWEDTRWTEDVIYLLLEHEEIFQRTVEFTAGRDDQLSTLILVSDIARLDAATAARVAEIPLLLIDGRIPLQSPWPFLKRALEADAAAVNSILDSYELEGDIEYRDVPELIISLLGVYDPEVSGMLSALPWIQDGVSVTRFELLPRGDVRYGLPGEDETVRFLTENIIYDKRVTSIKLLGISWVHDTDMNWYKRRVLELLNYFSNEELDVLIPLQFLQSIDGHDRFTLLRLDAARPAEEELDYPFQDIIEHQRFGGDIFDRNQCYLEQVIEELRPGSPPVHTTPGEDGESC